MPTLQHRPEIIENSKTPKMDREEVIGLVNQLFEREVKGQVQIDFSGDGRNAKVRFTNITIEDLEKISTKYSLINHSL